MGIARLRPTVRMTVPSLPRPIERGGDAAPLVQPLGDG
jgi:hypothetical protein